MEKEQLENIMKPYYDEKAKIEDISNKYTEDKKFIELKLEKIRKSKKNELDSYISSALNFKRDFCDREDLSEKRNLSDSYMIEEEQLESELRNLEIESKNQILNLLEPLQGVKKGILNKLLREQKKIIIKLQENRLALYTITERINLSVKNNNQDKPTNTLHRLHAIKNSISSDISKLSENLKIIEGYLDELALGETKIILSDMDEFNDEEIDYNNDVVKEDDPVIVNYDVNDPKNTVTDYSELVKSVYNDVTNNDPTINSVKLNSSKEELNSNERYISSLNKKELEYDVNGVVDLNSISLPNGEYINTDDFNEALKQYYKKVKNENFVVKEIGKSLKISKKEVRKFKLALKECSTIILLNDKKITNNDIKRVLGKEKAKKFEQSVEIGISKTDAKEGNYVSRNELIYNLKNIFDEKGDAPVNVEENENVHKK